MAHLCPRCHQTLLIPKPTPKKVQCAGCGASINLSKSVPPIRQGTEPAADALASPIPMDGSATAKPILNRSTSIRGKLLGLILIPIALGLVAFAISSVAFFMQSPSDGGDGPQIKTEFDDPPLVKKRPLTEREKKIRAAAMRGAVYLKKRLLEGKMLLPASSRWRAHENVGVAALVGLALLETGHPPNDPAVRNAHDIVRKEGLENTMVYSIGSILFFLNRLDEHKYLTDEDRKLIRILALRLIHGQRKDGKWGYSNPAVSANAEKVLMERLQSHSYKPTWRGDGITTTTSMTQFALLSLWGCRKHGIPVRQPILHAAAAFHNSQHDDGSWNYAKGYPASWTDSNTCAGLLALAMETTLREDKEFRAMRGPTDPSLNPRSKHQREKAMTFLAKAIGPGERRKRLGNEGYNGRIITASAWGDYYFLWCLERMAVIYGLERIGSKDWYGWGSDAILKHQRKDGSWHGQHGQVVDTCFAILFLMKANLAKDLTDKWRELQAACIKNAPARHRLA